MITDNMVVSMNYTLRNQAGTVLDASKGEPFEYLQGHGNIIPGLESALIGAKVGEKKQVEVQPEQGYGHHDPNLLFTMKPEQFGDIVPDEGSTVQLTAPNGQPFLARIAKVEQDAVQLDANHPLAGEALYFDVEIVSIRDASQEEIAHGHPHGPHGHHH